MVAAHGVDEYAEVAARRGHVLKEYLPGEVARVAEHVADGYGVEQPVGYTFVMLVAFGDVVVECVRVALDGDAEQLLDGLPVAVECASGQRLALGERRALPLFVEFGTGDAPVAAYRVHNPDVAGQEVAAHCIRLFLRFCGLRRGGRGL